MRTTVTLEPDVESLVRKTMSERGISFKEAINAGLRDGLARQRRAHFRQRTFPLGWRPGIDYDKALQTAAALEDQEILRDLAVGR